MIKSRIFSVSMAAILALSLTSCRHDDDHDHEGELITTVHLHLTSPTGAVTMATWKDISPDDAAGRTIDTLYLDDATVYTGRVEFRDESRSPAGDITAEIRKEADEHLVIYRQEPALNPAWFTVLRTDKDSRNRELGLQYNLETRSTTGITGLRVILRHQPGSKDGTETPGDDDVNVLFPVKIR